MPLTEIRNKIDKIDDQLLKLFAERAECVHEVGVIKKNEGLEIYAPDREELLLRKLADKNTKIDSKLPEKSIRAIYREIMSAAKALEEELTIAVLGPEGTWTHQAAIKRFGHALSYDAKPNIADIFDMVERGKVNYGVVPIENSTEGAVIHTLDLFINSPLKIFDQIMMRIEHCLLSNTTKDKIKVIYSHPQALGQCKQWLRKNFPDAILVEVASTAAAAELAKQNVAEGAAALASKLAAEINGLDVLEESIQDQSTNTTRFLVIGEKTCPPTGKDRTSILFSVKDSPGSLVSALRSFESFEVNMSKIESRPSKQKDWEYVFYVDLAGHCEDDDVAKAIRELEVHCSLVKILGSYPDSNL